MKVRLVAILLGLFSPLCTWAFPIVDGISPTFNGQAYIGISFAGPPNNTAQTFTLEILDGSVDSVYGRYDGVWISHFYIPGEPRTVYPIFPDGECYANQCNPGDFLEFGGSGNFYTGRVYTPEQIPLGICLGPGGIEEGDFGVCGTEINPFGYYLDVHVFGTGDIRYRFSESDPVSLSVPEPQTWGLLLIGLAGMEASRRLKRRIGPLAGHRFSGTT